MDPENGKQLCPETKINECVLGGGEVTEEVLEKKFKSFFILKFFFSIYIPTIVVLEKLIKNKIIVKVTTKANVYFNLNGRVAR